MKSLPPSRRPRIPEGLTGAALAPPHSAREVIICSRITEPPPKIKLHEMVKETWHFRKRPIYFRYHLLVSVSESTTISLPRTWMTFGSNTPFLHHVCESFRSCYSQLSKLTRKSLIKYARPCS